MRVKTGYYLKLLMPATMTLLGSTKSKITKDKNAEIVSYLVITNVVFIHCNDYQQYSRACIHLFLINYLVNIQELCIHLFLINYLVNY